MAVVLDAFSRRVVGWALNRSLRSAVAVDALQQAIDTRKPLPGLVHHSDRGVQYASDDYIELLQKTWGDLQHEPSRKSIRQCPMRKLPEDAETGRNLLP